MGQGHEPRSLRSDLARRPGWGEAVVDDPDNLIALFREHGLKVTPQRQCIFEILYDDSSHPTAEAVYDAPRKRMPTISLKTVYETLHSLASLGQIHQVDVGTRSVHYDPDLHQHHLVCRSCASIENVDLDVKGLALTAAEPHGFVVDQSEVILRGLCAQCAPPASAELGDG